MKKTVKTVWNTFTTVLIVLVVIFAMLLVGARLVGLQVFTVLSGSMEPNYHTGSLIYVREVEPYTVEVDQVITFMLDEDTVATHRVVEVVPDEADPSVVRYRTKGDANDAVDGSLVHYKNVIGSPVFTIPYLGYVANYIQNPPGMYIAIAAGAILILLVFLPDLFESEVEEEEKSHKKKKKTTAPTAAPVKRANTSTVGATASNSMNKTAAPVKRPATTATTTTGTPVKRPATPTTTATGTPVKRPATTATTATGTPVKRPATTATTTGVPVKRPAATTAATSAAPAKRPATPTVPVKRPAPPAPAKPAEDGKTSE